MRTNPDNKAMKKSPQRKRTGARERLLDSAYTLFSTQGTAQVGIDKIIAKSGCAKASLYTQFGSKDGLVLAFLDRREELWTRGWLESQVMKRAVTPEDRLLTIFNIFDEWFRRKDFEGCSFINVLLETERNSPVNRAAAAHLLNIRNILHGFAEEADLVDIEQFIQVWHIIMKGSIISATEGNRNAAKEAKLAASKVLAAWPRTAADT